MPITTLYHNIYVLHKYGRHRVTDNVDEVCFIHHQNMNNVRRGADQTELQKEMI
jgi:hypothetical protein